MTIKILRLAFTVNVEHCGYPTEIDCNALVLFGAREGGCFSEVAA